MKRSNAFALLTLLCACTQHNLDLADQSVQIAPDADLDSLHVAAQTLAQAYAMAARKTVTTNTIGSYVVIAAAAGAASAATAAATATATNVGIVGATTGVVTKREAAKASSDAIYSAAKRLECIASITGIALSYTMTPADLRAAAYATAGSIESVKIDARTATVQEVADYAAVLKQVRDAATQQNIMESVPNQTAGTLALNTYLAMLTACANSAALPKDVTIAGGG